MRYGAFFAHVIFFLLTVCGVGWLLWLNVVPRAEVTYVQDFERRSPFVSDLWPPEALLPVQSGARPFVKDEVTFFMRPPRHFERVQLGITFSKLPSGLKPKLFVQTSASAGTWQEIEWQYTASERAGKGTYYQATFQLNPHWRSVTKRYNMKIGVAGLEQQRIPVYADEISARFLDPAVTLGTFWRLLRE